MSDESKEKKLGLRLPVELHAALVKMAEKDRRSLHSFIIVTLEKAAREASERGTPGI